ncbi:MFS transporter [Dyella flagellata]|uniref:MFS transporter n=1 Tax=Dyella flagellata TaxID=1867833 RepID=A0ABQ5X6J7_9GAMM|nr:MFS transporter [Dyella flagellata]GLQ86829.1 MFS transporter [Dyella flagellata]
MTRTILGALALGTFAMGVTEFTPMGLLPPIASNLNVSIPTAGMLVTAFAIGVMVGAPVVTLLLGRLSRKTALLSLMGLFIAGNALSAIAPDYGILVLARVLTSLSHGAFFGIGVMVAIEAAPATHNASAVSSMFMGLTIANIGGVPAATWLGTTLGWRSAFGGIAILGVLALAALAMALPSGRHDHDAATSVRRELRVLTSRSVVLALLTTAFGAGAMFALFTYVAALLERLTHASASFITAMLALIGIGFTLGNAISGRLADKSLQATLLSFLSLLALLSFAFPFAATTHLGAAVALLLWGAATFGVVAPVQMRVMQEAHSAPGLASSVNISAFNLGNALGATVGGWVISAGLGYAWVAPAGGMLACIAGFIALLNRNRRTIVSNQIVLGEQA